MKCFQMFSVKNAPYQSFGLNSNIKNNVSDMLIQDAFISIFRRKYNHHLVVLTLQMQPCKTVYMIFRIKAKGRQEPWVFLPPFAISTFPLLIYASLLPHKSIIRNNTTKRVFFSFHSFYGSQNGRAVQQKINMSVLNGNFLSPSLSR